MIHVAIVEYLTFELSDVAMWIWKPPFLEQYWVQTKVPGFGWRFLVEQRFHGYIPVTFISIRGTSVQCAPTFFRIDPHGATLFNKSASHWQLLLRRE